MRTLRLPTSGRTPPVANPPRHPTLIRSLHADLLTAVYYVCTLTTDLSDIPRSEFQTFTNVGGEEFYRIKFKLQMTLSDEVRSIRIWHFTHTLPRVADGALLVGLEVRVDIQGQTLRVGRDTVHLRVVAGAGSRPYGEAAVMAIYLEEYARAGVVDSSM
jgi:hypothetical protein